VKDRLKRLLSIPVLLVMMLLSGSTTPLESMPVWLAHVMNVISPTPHFVVFAQDGFIAEPISQLSGPKFWPHLLSAVCILESLCIASAGSSSAARIAAEKKLRPY
jgi:hypothetical protein